MKFKYLIHDIAIGFWFSRNFASMEDKRIKCNSVMDLSSNKKILNGIVALDYNQNCSQILSKKLIWC